MRANQCRMTEVKQTTAKLPLVIENKGSGMSLIQDLQQQGIYAIRVGDKVMRMHAQARGSRQNRPQVGRRFYPCTHLSAKIRALLGLHGGLHAHAQAGFHRDWRALALRNARMRGRRTLVCL